MPGVNLDSIVEQTGFKVIFDQDCSEIEPPNANELFCLRYHVDPLGLRRLEFVSAKERASLLDDVLALDGAVTDGIVGGAK